MVWNMFFPYIGNNHPNWQIFFRRVQTTNQYNSARAVGFSHSVLAKTLMIESSWGCDSSGHDPRQWLIHTPVQSVLLQGASQVVNSDIIPQLCMEYPQLYMDYTDYRSLLTIPGATSKSPIVSQVGIPMIFCLESSHLYSHWYSHWI